MCSYDRVSLKAKTELKTGSLWYFFPSIHWSIAERHGCQCFTCTASIMSVWLKITQNRWSSWLDNSHWMSSNSQGTWLYFHSGRFCFQKIVILIKRVQTKQRFSVSIHRQSYPEDTFSEQHLLRTVGTMWYQVPSQKMENRMEEEM